MHVLFSITTAFLIAFSAMPIVIRVFRSLDLLDNPNRRKVHSVSTPSLGGIAIYLAAMISLFFWVPIAELSEFKFLLLAIFFAFLLGVRDDISSLQALDKLTIQVFAALLVVFVADINFSGLYGIFGFTKLPTGIAEFISIFAIVGLTNAFNLIDGIDGLAGCIACLILGGFSWWFFIAGYSTLGFISVTMGSAVFAFLFYNWSPSKIFMGDTGSMVLGFTISVLMIKFIELNSTLLPGTGYYLQAPVAMSFALLVLPVYDTFRVFVIRFLAGRSPMSPDKNHVHHVLLKLGFTHAYASIILVSFNTFLVGIAWFLQPLGNNWLSLIILIFAISFGGILDYRLRRKAKSIMSLRRNPTITAS
ncbi:MAG: undecaprenyl/decaprenyl-phosphate alpha-N-acetylglucosaminyl 1-phosphate transferase [Cytophagales bacterium]|nr:undecaprenyl/decaprenyl-phosphate alpha-N-acetylglucosaminyl 1-phosphate transferase [Cytophagales bacterium]